MSNDLDVSKVVGGTILMVGDLHISDVFEGKHKDYLKNCLEILGKIEKEVNKINPSAVVFLGDLVGWNESNIKRREVLSVLCKFFMRVGEGRRVYCVRGNHDMKGYPEFQFLSDLHLFETASTCNGYFDFYGTDDQIKPEVRFHIVDYKQETRELDLAQDGVSNVVLAHNNFTIQGVTTWYKEHDGIELSMLQNFTGVDMVVSGHIHNPSPDFYATQMIGGGDCALFYTGCPTRPIREKNIYEKCWFLTFTYDNVNKETSYDAHDFVLAPSEEIFHMDEEFIADKTEEEIADELRTQALKEVLDDIMKYRIGTGDLLESISNIPNASESAKDLAKSYLQFALNAKQS